MHSTRCDDFKEINQKNHEINMRGDIRMHARVEGIDVNAWYSHEGGILPVLEANVHG